LARRQCKSRWRGCFAVRRTFFSFQAPRHWPIFERTWQPPPSACLTRRSPHWTNSRKGVL